MKPRIAVFSLTGCEGCSLAILELEDQLLDLLGAVEIVNFREAMTERNWDIDVGFVDGAVSTPEDEEELRHLREQCRTLVALGACACLGGINTLKNHQDPADCGNYVYGERRQWFATMEAQPLSKFVPVDYELPGCPSVKEEFVRFVTDLLDHRTFQLPSHAVCVECKQKGILCLYERGTVCLGPATRGGCGAICPAFGSKCEGCRGLISQEALVTAGINLREQYGRSLEDILAEFRLFGAYQEEALP